MVQSHNSNCNYSSSNNKENNIVIVWFVAFCHRYIVRSITNFRIARRMPLRHAAVWPHSERNWLISFRPIRIRFVNVRFRRYLRSSFFVESSFLRSDTPRYHRFRHRCRSDTLRFDHTQNVTGNYRSDGFIFASYMFHFVGIIVLCRIVLPSFRHPAVPSLSTS